MDRRPSGLDPRAGPDAVANGRSVRPSTPQDGPAIVALMREAGLEPDADPAHMYWKYWQPRADWPAPRSFVLAEGGELLAHGALMPGTLRWGASQARLIHMIDWAAQRQAVGAGVQLMKHVGRQADLLLGIGGSEQTRKIMPLIGYRLCAEVTGFVRPLSLARRLRRIGGAHWKTVPRLARCALWSLSAPRPEPGTWRSRPIPAADVDQIVAMLPTSSAQFAALGRSPAFFRHALACPVVPVELHALEKAGRSWGYFALSYPPGQARLADLWMNSADPTDWRALVHAAVCEARRHADVAELAAWSSDPALSRVLRDCGFHARFTLPVYLRASAGFSAPEQPPRVQMLDNDAFYLCFGRNELWA